MYALRSVAPAAAKPTAAITRLPPFSTAPGLSSSLSSLSTFLPPTANAAIFLSTVVACFLPRPQLGGFTLTDLFRQASPGVKLFPVTDLHRLVAPTTSWIPLNITAASSPSHAISPHVMSQNCQRSTAATSPLRISHHQKFRISSTHSHLMPTLLLSTTALEEVE